MPILYTKARPRGSKIPPSWWASGSNRDFSGYANLGDELTPNLSLIDVVNTFPWTLTPANSEARKEAPYIFLREFLQLETQLNQCAEPYGKRFPSAGGIPSGSQFNENGILPDTGLFESVANLIDPLDANTTNLYKGLFDHINQTDFYYKLPFFTPDYFSINNNWEATDVLDKVIEIQTKIGGVERALIKSVVGDKGEGFGKFLESLPRLYKQIEMFNIKAGNPAVGLMDPPRVWKGTVNRTYSFEFPLYNVDASGSTNPTELIIKNWEFCFLITYQNLINKRNYFTGIPPVFYEVTIPGIHYCKASYISDLTIENIGNIRLMRLNLNNNLCEVNIPDGYSIKITLTDLLQPSKNLLAATIKGKSRIGGVF